MLLTGTQSKTIVFVQAGTWAKQGFSHPLQADPPLALKYAASMLSMKGKYEIEIVDWCKEALLPHDLAAKVCSQAPFAVIVFVKSFCFEKTLEFAEALRAMNDGIFIAAAGHDATARPHAYSFVGSPFDLVLRGECDEGVIDMLHRWAESPHSRGEKTVCAPSAGSLPSRAFNIASAPLLEYTIEELRKYPFIYPVRLSRKIFCGYIMTSCGCAHDCIFCTQVVRKTYAKELRFRPAADVADEIEKMMAKGVNFISFVDDNFAGSRAHVTALCEEILKRRLKVHWAASARIDELDRELLELMKKSGCVLLLLSIESGVSRVIRRLNKTKDAESWAEIARSVFFDAKRVGIEGGALFIVGSPGETWEDVQQSISLAKELDPAFVKVHFFTPYPGTPAYESMAGCVPAEKLAFMHHYLPPFINVSGMTMGKLLAARGHFYRKFFLRADFITQHLFKYFMFYVFNLNVLRLLSVFFYGQLKTFFSFKKERVSCQQ